MKQLTLDELCTRLRAARDPVILIHTKPDGDAVGSAVALCRFFSGRGQAPSIRCADPIPARLKFLLEGLSLSPTDDTSGRTVISVDVASPSQLGSLREAFADAGKVDLMIDHHEVGTPFADHLVMPHAAASGEVLYEVLAHMEDSPEPTQGRTSPAVWTRELCGALYAAISSDTGCFKYSNATPRTHMAAAKLLERGIDAARINHLLFDSKSREVLTAEGMVSAGIQTAADGRISYAIVRRADMTRAALSDEHFETGIDIVRSLAGAEIAFLLKEQPNGTYRVSLRSTGADVASVAAVFGGGGHLRAAGCSLSGMTEAEAVSALLAHLTPLLAR
jgi:phosphoesterase RecJ-like protein